MAPHPQAIKRSAYLLYKAKMTQLSAKGGNEQYCEIGRGSQVEID
jgi:hypothetical protein